MISFEKKQGRKSIMIGFCPLDGSDLSMEMLRAMRDEAAKKNGLAPEKVAIVNRQQKKGEAHLMNDKEKNTLIQLKGIEKTDHLDFKIICLEHGTTMSAAIRAYIKAVITGEAEIYRID